MRRVWLGRAFCKKKNNFIFRLLVLLNFFFLHFIGNHGREDAAREELISFFFPSGFLHFLSTTSFVFHERFFRWKDFFCVNFFLWGNFHELPSFVLCVSCWLLFFFFAFSGRRFFNWPCWFYLDFSRFFFLVRSEWPRPGVANRRRHRIIRSVDVLIVVSMTFF